SDRVRRHLDAEWDRVTAPAAAPQRSVGPGPGVGGARRWGPVWVRAAAAGIALVAADGLRLMVVAPGGFGRRVHGPVALREPTTANGPAAPAQPCDIDGSGGVDMVDAFVLARAIADEEARGGGRSGVSGLWDVTGDGVVDGGDVDA